jgi:cellulose synthase/poly-beta-1,6-N-acetylglucosamine synthase-like glycosyltransferase
MISIIIPCFNEERRIVRWGESLMVIARLRR